MPVRACRNQSSHRSLLRWVFYSFHAPHFSGRLRSRSFELGRARSSWASVNCTPDSFSDGGLYLDRDRAVEHALRLLDEGADLLDIGGESTRPGARVVDAANAPPPSDTRVSAGLHRRRGTKTYPAGH